MDAFEPWCWRRFLSIPWTSRTTNQSVVKEINLEYSLQGLMLKLKLQYFGHLMGKVNSLEKTLMLGKTEGKWLDSITDSMDINLNNLREIMKDREVWRAAVHGLLKSRI